MRRSAGLLLYRRAADIGTSVLLGHPGGPLFARRNVWGIPKGECEPDEQPEAAAYREFAEELGLAPPDGDLVPLGEARQRSGKVNVVWALEGNLDVSSIRSNEFEMAWPPRSGRVQRFPELDRAAWFDLATARSSVFPSQVVFLDRLEAYLGGRKLP